MVTESVCRNYSFPSFFMFSLCCADCTLLPFPCSPLFTHSFPLPHSSPCCISGTLRPESPNHPHFALHLNFTLTNSLSSGSVAPFLTLSCSLFSTVATLLSLPDIVARCPMSHTSAKIIRGGGDGRRSREREPRKEVAGERAKAGAYDREKNIENKKGRREEVGEAE